MNTTKFSLTQRVKAAVTLACLLLSLPSASAQTVHSVNAVGYADVHCVAGLNLVATPFASMLGTIASVLPEVPDGSYFVLWNPATGQFEPTNFFSQPTGWTEPNAVLMADAGFLWLPAARRISLVGEVWMMPYCLDCPARTNIVTSLPEFTCISDGLRPMAFPDGAMVWKWDAPAQQWDLPYTFLTGSGWTREGQPAVPQLAPSEGVRLWVPQAFTAFARGAPGCGCVAPPPLTPVSVRPAPRTETNVMFQFTATNPVAYALLQSTNLSSAAWQLVWQGTNTPTGGVARVTVPAGTNGMAFYRLVPPPSPGPPVLTFAARRGTEFRLEFHVRAVANYQVQRLSELPHVPIPLESDGWETIQTIAAAPATLVTVIDTNATAATGYYRLQYQP